MAFALCSVTSNHQVFKQKEGSRYLDTTSKIAIVADAALFAFLVLVGVLIGAGAIAGLGTAAPYFSMGMVLIGCAVPLIDWIIYKLASTKASLAKAEYVLSQREPPPPPTSEELHTDHEKAVNALKEEIELHQALLESGKMASREQLVALHTKIESLYKELQTLGKRYKAHVDTLNADAEALHRQLEQRHRETQILETSLTSLQDKHDALNTAKITFENHCAYWKQEFEKEQARQKEQPQASEEETLRTQNAALQKQLDDAKQVSLTHYQKAGDKYNKLYEALLNYLHSDHRKINLIRQNILVYAQNSGLKHIQNYSQFFEEFSKSYSAHQTHISSPLNQFIELLKNTASTLANLKLDENAPKECLKQNAQGQYICDIHDEGSYTNMLALNAAYQGFWKAFDQIRATWGRTPSIRDAFNTQCGSRDDSREGIDPTLKIFLNALHSSFLSL